MAQPSARVLDKLEWPAVLDLLAGHSQTGAGRARALQLKPTLTKDGVRERWLAVTPLKTLAEQGYKAPIGDVPEMGGIFRAAGLGQILDGPALRAVAHLLEATRRVDAFAGGFAGRCPPLTRVKARILTLPALAGAINKAIGENGELLDDASPGLKHIRRQKVTLRRRIEEIIGKLLTGDRDLAPYLQDHFFTLRSERYVVPMKLDGRGRVAGRVLDTSASGQTLFIELGAVMPLNDQLLELDVEEKLEIARIFRELSSSVEADVETLRNNYDELVELDQLTAEAALAGELQAGTALLVDAPVLTLKNARHPLLRRGGGKGAVANSVTLKPEQTGLIVSGPNAGGKTVVLKTVGLLHVMAKAGLLIPAAPDSELFLYDNIFLEMGDAQNLTANLSTFSGHLLGLKPILEGSSPRDLALLDELAVGTDPETGAAIATAVLESLAERRVTVVVTTHFDALKGLAISDARFRNGSMEFALGQLTPTYKLVLDVPGQSYGLEVAEQIGLPPAVLARAKELRHGTESNLDRAVNELMLARDDARRAAAEAESEKLKADAERGRWQQEVELLKEQRQRTAKQLTEKYEARMQDLKNEFDEVVKKLRQAAKSGGGGEAAVSAAEDRKAAGQTLRNMEHVVKELAQSFEASPLPGKPAQREALAPGIAVFVLPLKKAGTVLRVGAGGDETVEVEVGVIKLRVSLHDLRILSSGEGAKKVGGTAKAAPAAGTRAAIPLTLPMPTNTLDLRGRDAESAVAATWSFIDRALLRGEETLVIIHGHGEGTLKAALRTAFAQSCPYDIRFRPGLAAEGGDGVTIVQLQT